MHLAFLFIVAISLALQVAAAVLAMRLIRITGTNRAWVVIALAMLAAAIRRLAVLVGVLANPRSVGLADLGSELLGLLFTILLLVGIASIAPLLRSIQQAGEAMQRARDQLEHEVRQRTSDLVRANGKLQAEFAQRAKAEETLREEHRNLRRVMEMSERDQKLLAYDIHDGFVQPATAAVMNLQAGLSAHAADPEKTLENVVRALQLLQESMSQVRWLISGLRPVVLEELGLVAAVNKLVHDTRNRTEIQICWSHQVQFDRLVPTLEMAIFRIVQEALRNAVFHSQSDRVEIALTQADGTIRVTVRDWGCGFDVSVHKPGHFGLEGMQERARLFGGAARIESTPRRGTCVTAEFSLVEKEAETEART